MLYGSDVVISSTEPAQIRNGVFLNVACTTETEPNLDFLFEEYPSESCTLGAHYTVS